MVHTDKLYLIGFMGSGKTTTGMRLARHLNWSFFDIDKEIERKAEMKISDIFRLKGESVFRKLEAETLSETKSLTKAIISTGGGTPCFEGNMEFMTCNGLTVYLKASPVQLMKRLENSKGERPLLNEIPKDQLQNYITAKLSEREIWYSKAEIVIDSNNTTFQQLCTMVKSLIR